MEIKKTACQPPAVATDTNAHRRPGAGEARTIGKVPGTRVGKAIAAIVCSAAVLAAAGAPVALGSVPPRGRSVARLELVSLRANPYTAKPNNAFVDSQLAQLKQTTRAGEGIILGMENFLRALSGHGPQGRQHVASRNSPRLSTGPVEAINRGMSRHHPRDGELPPAFPVKVPKAGNTLSHKTAFGSQLAQLRETTGAGEGIILGMENFLRAFPVKVLS